MNFRRKTYRIQDLEKAVTSQHLPAGKIITAAEQALSLWSSVAPISFKKLTQTGVEPDVHIRFINLHDQSLLGNGTGDINTGNRYFIDFYNEEISSIDWGPFDLVGVIAHEVGHRLLGTDHLPNNQAIMYKDFSEEQIKRFLHRDDVVRVQTRYGRIGLGGNIPANLERDTSVMDEVRGVLLTKENNTLQIIGQDNTYASLIISFPKTKNISINAIDLQFSTLTPNVIVNSLELLDGTEPIQKYFLSCRNNFKEENQLKEWNLKLGLLNRKKMHTHLVAKINIQFKRYPGDDRWATGEVRFTSVSAETLLELEDNSPTS